MGPVRALREGAWPIAGAQPTDVLRAEPAELCARVPRAVGAGAPGPGCPHRRQPRPSSPVRAAGTRLLSLHHREAGLCVWIPPDSPSIADKCASRGIRSAARGSRQARGCGTDGDRGLCAQKLRGGAEQVSQRATPVPAPWQLMHRPPFSRRRFREPRGSTRPEVRSERG